ncbi:MAG: DUF881 domain-containing protein [Bacillota bacterium]
MRSRGAQVAVALVMLVLGLMLALQYRVQQRAATDLAHRRTEELVELLQKAETERRRLEQEVAELRNTVSRLTQGQAAFQALQEELAKAQMLAGLVPVKGPGVTVTMDDSKRPIQKGQDINAFLLHDEDVLRVVNELFAAGAEAMSLNGQRVIATTEVRCAGPTISVNRVMTAPPIVIQAIGDPDVLERALRMRGGVVESLSFWGIEVTVKKEAEVTIPAYSGSLRFQYGRVAQTGGK